MADLYLDEKPGAKYKDRRFGGSTDERERLLAQSTTLYIGFLSFYTSEEQLWLMFSTCGEVKRIIMGLDRNLRTPCGFAFVEYFTRADAQNAVYLLNGIKLDERSIRVDWDTGFEPGRQYGRGRSGGQVRDEWRTDFDPGRGGYGKAVQAGVSGTELWNAGEAADGGVGGGGGGRRGGAGSGENDGRFERERGREGGGADGDYSRKRGRWKNENDERPYKHRYSGARGGHR